MEKINTSRCKETGISDGPRSMNYHQCYNKPWRDGYCKIHHPDTIAERRRKSDEQYEIKKKKSAWYLLMRAQEKIVELESQIAELTNKLISK